jgi:hypothetical protein
VILRLTVQDINSRKIGDIELNASPDDWVGALLSALPGVSQGDACFVGAAMLDPATRLAGSPLLPGAVLSVGGAGPDYQPVRGAAAGTLHVIEGPDAGFGVALRPGRYFIGRSPDSHVSLHDVDVSRTHALVEVSAEGRAVIFDEFARVPDASQDLLKELVDVAARGRPLGVHLVLATQSPGGRLPPELKDNIALRISLRQGEAADSVEVLGTPEAITIPSALPGRGMILSTTSEPRTPRPFQSGCLGDPPLARSVAPLTVRPLAWADLGVARPAAAARAGGGPTDQDLVTQAIEEAARHLRRHPGGR